MILSDVHQFSIITELLGTPPEDVIKTIASENVRLDISLATTTTRQIIVLPDFTFCKESPQEG